MSVFTRMTKMLEASGKPGKQTASEGYAAKRLVVDKRLKEIEVLLGKHATEQAKKPLSFGYPGDLDYAIEQLDDLIEHFK